MEKEIFDVIIIGGGPAGMSAAIYTTRKSLKTLLITKTIGGNAIYAGSVENYLGFSPITGVDLIEQFRNSLKRFEGNDLKVLEGMEVTNIAGKFPDFEVETVDNQKYFGKTVIITTGKIPKMLNIPGEKEFLGRGVATCATCDAPLFKGKDVAVAGGGNAALDTILSLSKVAKSIIVVNDMQELSGDELRAQKIKSLPQVKILNNNLGVEILGDQVVTGFKIKNKQTGQQQTLDVQGIFIEVGFSPATNFVKLTNKDKNGQILVDENLATSVPGIWAAGDVNSLWGEQIIISAGEGAKAALSAHQYLLDHN